MELNQERIEAAIVEEAASKLISDGDLWNQASRAFEARVAKLWSETVEARIQAAVDDAITKGFERGYCKVDSFGRPVGQPTTIGAELERMIDGYWNTHVGSDGKPTTSHYNNPATRAEWLMTKLCADDFAGRMKDHVINVGGALKDGFRKELNATVNRLLSDVFHVRSLDDQGKGREIIDPVAKPLTPPATPVSA